MNGVAEDFFSRNSVYDNNGNFNLLNDEGELIEPLAVYDYDYRSYLQTIINNQNNLFSQVEYSNKLINECFTFISFVLIVSFLYTFIKNIIRK